jgi:Mrp family chromosome partitioning ATPase
MEAGEKRSRDGSGSLLDDSLHWYFDVPWRRLAIVLAALAIVPIAALVTELRKRPLYEATAQVLLSRENLAASLTGKPDSIAAQDPVRLAQTLAALARTEPVATLAARRADADTRATTRGEQLLRASTVRVKDGTDLLEFHVRDNDRTFALRAAQAYATAFVTYRRQLELTSLRTAQRQLNARLQSLRSDGERRSKLHATLVRRARELRSLAALETGNALAVRSPRAQQVEPKPLRAVLFASALAGVLGLALAFLWERLDRRQEPGEDAEERLRLPVLARLSDSTAGLGGLSMLTAPTDEEAAGFRALRINLDLVNRVRGARTIMFTSAGVQPEKAVVAANLALAVTRAGRHVVLVELAADEPSLPRLFGLAERTGIVDVALGHARLESSLATVDLGTPGREEAHVGRNNGAPSVLEVLALGSSPPDSSLLAGRAVADVLERLTERADLVLIDGPPLFPANEALDGCAEALVVVTRANALRRHVQAGLVSALEESFATPLGLVLIGESGRPGADGDDYQPATPAWRPESVA